MRIEWEGNWGKPADESESGKRRNHIFEYLKKAVLEHHPILKKIANRERDIERLKKLSRQELEGMYAELTAGFSEEEGEQARKKIAAQAKDIRRLKELSTEELKDAYAKLMENFQPSAFEKARRVYAARDDISFELCWEDWDAEYEFKSDFENFLWDIAYQRHYLREELLLDDDLYHTVGQYLKNPSWHSKVITNFLLIDLIDTYLIDLDAAFHFGLFPARLANQFGGPGSHFVPFINSMSPGLSPKAKTMRGKWRFKNLMVGSGLIYIWIGSWRGEKVTDLLANHGLDLPSWIFTVIGYIGIGFLVHPLLSLLYEFVNKIRTGYNKIAKAAREFVIVRFEIASGTYHGKTLIERLKKLEKQGIVIHSLTYALLELDSR